MRTKTLLIAAAALAATIMTSEAQVYSQNVVGYVSITVTNSGYTQINTPVDFDGTGTNNNILSLIGSSLPVHSQVLTWNGNGFNQDSYVIPKGQSVPSWSNTNLLLNPGLGYFVFNPSNFPVVLTYVGTVLQGSLTNTVIDTTGTFSMLGYMVPISGGIQTTLGYQPSPKDQVLVYSQALNSGAGGYSQFSFITLKGQSTNSWSPSEPQIQVGQGFFINTTNVNATINTNFVVP